MTPIGSNIGSCSGASSSRGPPVDAWVSLTLEEQLANFKRIFYKHWCFSSHCDSEKSIVKVVEKLRTDPRANVESLIQDYRHLRGATALHFAVLTDDRAMVQYILTSGWVDINATMGFCGETALHYAMYGGNHNIVEDLLQYKADVCICNRSDESALYYMVLQKDSMFGILKRILANNVNMCDTTKNTALHYATMEGAIDVVEYLLHEKVDVNLHNKRGNTPLHYAAKLGSLDVVTKLLQQNVNDNAVNDAGESPLHLAAKGGDMNIVSLLVQHNANVNALDKYGQSPLHLAAKKGDTNMVSLLVEYNANVNSLDKDGHNLLHLATKRGDMNMVSLLVEYNANVNALDKDGQSLLHLATKRGDMNIVSHLVEFNANVNALDKDGQSPLHFAIKRGDMNIVSHLVEHNANVNTLDKKGWSPLLLSLCTQQGDMFNALLASGADVHVKDKHGTNALHLVIKDYGRLFNKMHIVKLFRECDVDANAKNSKGYSPFFIAVARGHTEVVKEFLQSKEKLKLMEECNGQTAIQVAFDKGHEHIKRMLLECDDVSRYVGDLYRDRQVYVDAANAILVGAALIASVTFASWLQPPLGYTPPYSDLAPSSSDINYVDVQHNVSLRAFWIFNTLAFYFAIGTVVFGARSVLPRRRMFIKTIVVKLHQSLLVTSILLACSVFFVVIAFGIAGCIVLTPTLQFQLYMIVPTILGGLVCLVSLGLLFKSMVEDNLEKETKTLDLY